MAMWMVFLLLWPLTFSLAVVSHRPDANYDYTTEIPVEFCRLLPQYPSLPIQLVCKVTCVLSRGSSIGPLKVLDVELSLDSKNSDRFATDLNKTFRIGLSRATVQLKTTATPPQPFVACPAPSELTVLLDQITYLIASLSFWTHPNLAIARQEGGSPLRAFVNQTWMLSFQGWTEVIGRIVTEIASPEGEHLFPNVTCQSLLLRLDKSIEVVPSDLSVVLRRLDIYQLTINVGRLKVIPQFAFSNMANLTTLNLAHNNLQLVHPMAFVDTPRLRVLSLNWNSLVSIPDAIFNVHSLTTLDLSTNDRNFQLSKNESRRFSSIKYLTLTDNRIEHVPPAAFKSFPNLKILSLDICRIQTISDFAFKGLTHLDTLYLSNNQLAFVTRWTFAGMPGLKTLTLDKNFLLLGDASTFTSLGYLKFLDLSYNHLTHLPYSVLCGVQADTLCLKGNAISEWHHPLCREATLSIASLNLENNLITEITPAMVWDLNAMPKINMAGNPYDCDSCQLPVLQDWLHIGKLESQPYFFEYHCDEPEKSKGLNVSLASFNVEKCNKEPFRLPVGATRGERS